MDYFFSHFLSSFLLLFCELSLSCSLYKLPSVSQSVFYPRDVIVSFSNSFQFNINLQNIFIIIAVILLRAVLTGAFCVKLHWTPLVACAFCSKNVSWIGEYETLSLLPLGNGVISANGAHFLVREHGLTMP